MFTTDEINELNGVEVRACIEAAIRKVLDENYEQVMELAEQLWREGAPDAR
jgi:hypothetical protein